MLRVYLDDVLVLEDQTHEATVPVNTRDRGSRVCGATIPENRAVVSVRQRRTCKWLRKVWITTKGWA